MDEKVPYIVFEGELIRMERTIKRLWITTLLLIILLVGSNGAWLYYENQFADMTEIKQNIDTGVGDATVIGIGDYNGENQTDHN